MKATIETYGFSGFFTSQREALEFSRGLFDPGSPFIENLVEENGFSPSVASIGNDGTDTSCAGRFAVGGRVITLVGHGSMWSDVGSEVEQERELRAVTRFPSA
ncbi:hypothetical protein [Acetobacter persici]|uniref:hypothetical protein n=1 Tax=Acetobacter persici TaxID=1076596 RepID=UPI0012FE2D03|nr:hypothetical protein [Acetobacter persici]